MKQRYENLKRFVEAKGWTEAQAAEHFGCSVSMISRIINGKRKPNGALVIKMLAAKIDVNSHLGDSAL